MRTNYLLENHANAAESAEKVLEDKLLSDEKIKLEANYVAGMSNYHSEQYEKSLPYLKWTADNTGEVRGTEALFTLTYSNFHLGNYEKAEELHNKLLQRKPAYDYWIAKSLILQTRVFIAIDDLFQAEKTINLVINNYPNDADGVITEAERVKSELMQLKDKPKDTEDDTNRSIDLNEGDDE
jgi:tetratricopeptide (TPR) repeat protein